jgi:hypothetical protein
LLRWLLGWLLQEAALLALINNAAGHMVGRASLVFHRTPYYVYSRSHSRYHSLQPYAPSVSQHAQQVNPALILQLQACEHPNKTASSHITRTSNSRNSQQLKSNAYDT